MHRLIAMVLLAGLAFATTGCVIEEPGGGRHGGWCFWHPDRCR